MSLIQRLRGSEERSSTDLALSLQSWVEMMKFGGLSYGLTGNQTLVGDTEEIASSFQGYVEGAYKQNGIVFACIVARMLLFSEARFQYQRMRGGRPGNLFGSPDLAILEKPWPNGTTSDLLKRAEQDTSLAGNFYAARLAKDKLVRMRPDWVSIMLGSPDPSWEPGDLDTEVIGYLFHPGGPTKNRDPVPLLPEQVCHYAPITDPTAYYRGMSWITPIVREILGDKAAMEHKLRFFTNGATVNMVVKADPQMRGEQFDMWVNKFKQAHEGAADAYRTVFLGGGADMQAVGSNMQQIDFKVVQGAGETRIAAAAGIPPIIVGLSEGLEASTYSNYAQARRRFADGTMRPLWRDMAGALATVVPSAGSDTRLWYDARDIAFLQEDMKDEAEIQQTQSVAIKALVEAGYEPESVIKAVNSNDWSLLTHTGLFSVQLQAPGTEAPVPANGAVAPVQNGANGRRLLEAFVSNS